MASFIFPAGGQRGTTVPVRVGGLYLHERCGFGLFGRGVTASPYLTKTNRIWFEGPLIPLPDSQQAEDYPVDMLGSVTIDANSPLTASRVRVWTSQGAASGPVFVVGELPEIVERETDGDPIPEMVKFPVTVNGRIFPREDLDLWAISLKKGQTITAFATTTVINSPLVAKLDVADTTGRILAEAGTDASVRFTAPADGMYHVRITDARNLGGPAYVYRLTITDGMVVDHVFPLGGRRGETVAFHLTGQAVPTEPVQVKLSPDGTAAWQSKLDLDDLPEFQPLIGRIERIEPPAILNGRVEQPGAVNEWKLMLKKAVRYEVELRAKRLGSPLCGVVTITDTSGKELARAEGIDADPQFVFQPPADGVYMLRIAERFRGRGGPAFAYRLRVREVPKAAPDYRLRFAADVVNVERGTTAKLKVTAERLGGFAGPIDLKVDGLPDGVTAAKATLPANQTNTEIAFTAKLTAKVRPTTVTIGETQVLVAVAVPTPFKFTGEYTMNNAPRGQPYRRAYKLERNGFDGPIEVRLADRQIRHLQGVTGPTIVVPASRNDFEYAANLPPWIELGRTCRVTLMASGVVRDPDGTEHVVSFSSGEQNHQMIVVPEPGRLDVEVEKSSFTAVPGGTLRVPFRLVRAKGLTGPATVELVIPAHWRDVACDPITVTGDTGELLIRVGAKAPGPFNMPASIRTTIGNVVAETKLELILAQSVLKH